MIYLSVSNCAKICGMNRQAIYKMIRLKKIPFFTDSVFGKLVYRIPLQGEKGFLSWLEVEIERHEKRVNILKHSHKRLKEVLKNV